GQLYVEYMKKTHGAKSVGEMLEAFRQGLSTPAAIKKVCKVDRAEFEKGYREYLKELVKKIKGKTNRPARSFKELEQAHKKAPDDLNLAAELAERQLLRGNNKEALKLSKAVLRKKKNHPLASYVQAELLRKLDLEGTLKLLEGAVDRDHPELKVVKLLGEVYLNDVKEKDDAKKYAKAAEMFELARKLDPYDH